MPVRLAVCGIGAIGREHIRAIGETDAHLVAVADPVRPAPALVGSGPDESGVPWFANLGDLIGEVRPDGLIIATPNTEHVAAGLAAIEAGIPALVEKPLAVTVAEGRRLVEAAERAGVVLAVGHHRRHSPAMVAARDAVLSGLLGELRTLHASALLMKPDSYFEPPWRRAPGAGPILVNLIHDVDAMRYLAGDVAAVTAVARPSRRGHPVEDTAAVTLAFEKGALGTILVSDAAAGPWSWEFSAGENPMYPHAEGAAIALTGTRAALSVPDLKLWTFEGTPSWTTPLREERLTAPKADPLVRQVENFCAAIRGKGALRAPAREGLKTLAVVEAVIKACRTGRSERPSA